MRFASVAQRFLFRYTQTKAHDTPRRSQSHFIVSSNSNIKENSASVNTKIPLMRNPVGSFC